MNTGWPHQRVYGSPFPHIVGCVVCRQTFARDNLMRNRFQFRQGLLSVKREVYFRNGILRTFFQIFDFLMNCLLVCQSVVALRSHIETLSVEVVKQKASPLDQEHGQSFFVIIEDGYIDPLLDLLQSTPIFYR